MVHSHFTNGKKAFVLSLFSVSVLTFQFYGESVKNEIKLYVVEPCQWFLVRVRKKENIFKS